MRALIADDELNLAADLHRRLIQLWPELEIVSVVHDGVSAQRALASLSPDIAFLDIRMPGMSGLDAARSAQTNCRIVFVTAFDDHAVEAFEQAAVDYVLKPVSDERLQKCVERLKERSEVKPDQLLLRLQKLLTISQKSQPLRWLRVQVGQTIRMLAVEEVCYFQSADKYTAVFTRDAEFLLRTPLKELIVQLDADQFWQVHRSSVVNVNQIEMAKHDLLGRVTLTLRDRTESVSVSRTYAQLFKQM